MIMVLYKNCNRTILCAITLLLETTANSEEELSLTDDPTMSESKWVRENTIVMPL